MLECSSVIRTIPVVANEVEIFLYFHFYDNPDIPILIGRPTERPFQEMANGSLAMQLDESTQTVALAHARNAIEKFHDRFEDNPTKNPKDTLNHLDAQQRKEPSSVQIQPARNLLAESSPRLMVPPLPPDPPTKTFIMDAMEKKWSTGVEHFSEALWICSPSRILPCSIKGITIEAHLNPAIEVNIMPWHLAYTLLGNVTLRPSDKLLRVVSPYTFLSVGWVACVVPLLLDKIKVNLDFHIFDVLDLDLLRGSPTEKLLNASRGSLDKELREAVSTTTPLFSENSMVTPLLK
jgi:hypothetical protein